jgi:hypothetical protein
MIEQISRSSCLSLFREAPPGSKIKADTRPLAAPDDVYHDKSVLRTGNFSTFDGVAPAA